MKILLIDRGGYFLDFALRCKAAGHDVRWFLGKYGNGDRNPQGDGFDIQKVPHWEPHMRWADLIVLPDNSVYIEELDSYHRRGFRVYGGNLEVTKWEMDREAGSKIFEKAGLDIIPAIKFRRIDEGIAHLQANRKRYVSKLNDDNDTKAMSYVAKSPKDLLFMLDKWKKDGAMGTDFIFQEFVPGIEIAVGGFFGDHGFSEYFLENFEHKKLMAGEIGPNTGEMGTVMRYTNKSALAEHLLRPLEGDLYRAGYHGYFDIAVIVDKKGSPRPLEATARFGWPLFEIQQALHPDPVGWMYDSFDGKDSFKPKTKVAAGVVMTIPDFPFNAWPQKRKQGYPVYGWDDVPGKFLHMTHVMMSEAPDDDLAMSPCPVTTGECVCTVSGIGDTVRDAQEMVYRHVDRLEIPNSPMYRPDIGDRIKDELPEIQKHGWMKEWKF